MRNGPYRPGYSRFAPRADSLYRGRARVVHHEILVGKDAEATAYCLEKLARLEQKVGIAGPSVSLIARGEGLVKQKPARRHGVDQGGQQRPVEIIRHDHRVELPVGKGEGASIL